ncbi:3-keto-disaccharide hydrolase [Flammeovirga kamogawensis]|uniref:DUF1080 domain-containing protein n=1 Tax=Flammeovirga kamogawensis TaxID=373891 RepID=A0ABX8H315_9BACT|nr:DUF1080 domain-containing protein [Flammeovirga kamogawensis]MBB6460494.1 hypothetical protein [Flammeovirga kamogawensis]QWG10300.1 DUF1080 domain-containing protein [Flammeovirga kamogawensis]TRX64748.1 DUF1080 domain-containing protein [Flammeovirga kamogawensis]
MTNFICKLFLLLIITSCTYQEHQKKSLFNGETFEGWEGNNGVFRIENGAIIGGSLDKPLKKTHYLNTAKKYANFKLNLKVKIIDQDSSANAGISFRASRIPNSPHVAAYQADLGYGRAKGMFNFSGEKVKPKNMNQRYPLWGTLVDECREDHFRYPKPKLFPIIFLDVPERELVENTINYGGWNDIEVMANGGEIRIRLNGVETANFIETADVAKEGYICLQAHHGAPFEVHYKDILITEL